MEISTLIGLAGGFFAVILTMLIEGGNPISFVNLSALTLIAGGSAAVAVLSYSTKQLLQIPQYFMQVLFPPRIDLEGLVEFFGQIAEKARREGLLSLEDDMANFEDLIKAGMQLVVDGTDPEIVKAVLEDRMESEHEHEKEKAEFFETLGGFSPTLGIIGTVMGLVHVLESLGGGGGVEQLGRGIAVAFIATFYGIGFANLIWLPLANKTKYLSGKINIRQRMILVGVLSIQSGDNPRVLRERLAALVPDPGMRERIRSKEG